MRGYLAISFVLIMFLGFVNVRAQTDPKYACRVDDDRIVFSIDLRWTPAQQKELMQLFDLDSLVIAGVKSGKREMTVKGVKWNMKKISDQVVELSKSLTDSSSVSKGEPDVILLDDQLAGITIENTRESVPYGINKFTLFKVFRYAGGKARFFLPGHLEARQVVLSGTFNNWSTMQMPMHRTDSGWIYQLPLKPGKYQYKYIIDGRWTQDPYNKQEENDLQGGNNSVVFCYNHWFRLSGMASARRVMVTGSFNNWNEEELKMVRVGSAWVMQMYLREGTHAYKFLVDGQWMTDPAGKVTRPDGAGHFNSFVGIGDSAVFTLKGYPKARKVVLSGDFNGWNREELGMTQTSGRWTLAYALAPGVYEYKFIVDGEWILDPSNPVTTGQGETTNSVFIFQPNYTFTLSSNSDATKVVVAGSFNNWSRDAYRMYRKDFKWIFPVRLKPGKYTYKFVVDGKWILDPGNELWEENEFGTGNSVLWIEP